MEKINLNKIKDRLEVYRADKCTADIRLNREYYTEPEDWYLLGMDATIPLLVTAYEALNRVASPEKNMREAAHGFVKVVSDNRIAKEALDQIDEAIGEKGE